MAKHIRLLIPVIWFITRGVNNWSPFSVSDSLYVTETLQ